MFNADIFKALCVFCGPPGAIVFSAPRSSDCAQRPKLAEQPSIVRPYCPPAVARPAGSLTSASDRYHATMPEPQADPNLRSIRGVALVALLVGAVLVAAKFGIYWLTDSVAVLSDALESIINVVAAAVMLYSINQANRPADADHPYGHGKVEFMAVGLEGTLILLAGLVIAVEAIGRLTAGTVPRQLGLGLGLLAIVGIFDALLAWFVWRMGRRYQNDVLKSDGRHLFTDVASTIGVLIGLGLVRWTEAWWLDPVVALIMAVLIGTASWRLLWESTQELMDRRDPEDDRLIRQILDEEAGRGTIDGYHKLRHRHVGKFHWVDMHLQVDPAMTVAEGHKLASRIEHRIEQALGQANATAHLEPAQEPAEHQPQQL